MKVLFIGGTGLISSACTALAQSIGIEMFLLNRGRRKLEGVQEAQAALEAGNIKVIHADISQPGELAAAMEGQRFDVVVNWIAFSPEAIERDIAVFNGKVGQYIFISSASAYQRPATHYLVTESTPLANPFWEYSRNKIACEERLMRAYREQGFPVTIVRPSLTYGPTMIPAALGSWGHPWTLIERMLRGKPVVVHGDGSSLWQVTHNSDFAKGFCGLMGHLQATGHAFHITTDEVLTWDQIYQEIGRAAGVEAKLVHVSSDALIAIDPGMRGGLLGDKASSVVLDNSKIKKFVPGFVATKSFAQGIRETLAWFKADAKRQSLDAKWEAWVDKVVERYGTA